MITLSSKQTSYSIQNVGENYKINGSVSIAENGRIITFNGSFYNLENEYLGNFYYNENENEKSNKSISDVSTSIYENLDQFFDLTLVELKQTINEL